jgi:5-methylcytosine-specific restriction endonuclease McrA
MEYGNIICKHCGKEVKKNGANQIYCTRECAELLKQLEISKRQSAKRRLRFLIFGRDRFTCIYCGKSSIEDGVKLNMDHIIPYSIEKNSTIDNLITSCKECNLQKSSDLLPEDIIVRIKKVVKERNLRYDDKLTLLLNTMANEYFKEQKGC